jgi:hypothetical protein
LKLPNGKGTGFSHDYKRHGTTTLFAALDAFPGVRGATKAPGGRNRLFREFTFRFNRRFYLPTAPAILGISGRAVALTYDGLYTVHGTSKCNGESPASIQ